jgi:hypothetical protein
MLQPVFVVALLTLVMTVWAFARLRTAHSVVQATVDAVLIRFSLFLLSWVALGIKIVRGALAVF